MATRILIILASLVLIVLIIGAVIVMRSSSTSSKASPTPTASPAVKAAEASSSGQLQSTDEVVGSGAEAKEGSNISVKYTGSLENGTVFDSTDKHGGQPATFALAKGQLIEGWVQGIPGMKVGGKRKLVIPGDLAYGANPPQGSGIPPNATLVFEIELTDVK